MLFNFYSFAQFDKDDKKPKFIHCICQSVLTADGCNFKLKIPNKIESFTAQTVIIAF